MTPVDKMSPAVSPSAEVKVENSNSKPARSRASSAPKSTGPKARYIPGGPGGGGRYVYPDGTEAPVGGTGPGGYNYAGPKGTIGPMNAANGMKPPPTRTPRPAASRRPTARLMRPSVTLASPEEMAERRANQRRAAEIRKEKETFKPREEQSLYEFHPDLDVNFKMNTYSAEEVDGVHARPATPGDNTAIPTNGDHTPISSSIFTFGATTPGPTPQGDTNGIAASGGRSTRGRQTTTPGALSAAKTPRASRIVPLEIQPAKERLEMHRPTFRKVDTFANFKKAEVYIGEAMARVGYQASNTYLRQPQLHRQSETVPEDDQDKVEYDMDLFDSHWLELVNKQRGLEREKITPEILEITITRIEKEYAALERRVPKPNPRPPQTQRPRSSSAAAVNGEPQVASEEPDTTCVICDDGDCENTNAIVFCDGCNIPVHQECYGIPNIPEGQWLCRKCGLVGGGIPTCVFCPNTEGAFKQTSDQRWGHVLCAMWIPEISFPNTMFMEPIQDMNRIPKGRKNLLCYICNQQMGAPIQCGKANCYRAFHVSCARRAHLPLKMKNSQGVLAVNDTSLILRAFCDKHCPAEYAEDHDVTKATKDAQKYYKETMQARIWAETHDIAAAILGEYEGGENSQERELNGSRSGDTDKGGDEEGQDHSKNIWKLPSGAPVVPYYVLSKVEDYMSQFIKQGLSEWVTAATKYWTVKIEIRRGARLIRRYQLQNEGFSSMDTTRRDFNGMGVVGKGRLERRIDFVNGLSGKLSIVADHTNQDLDSSASAARTAVDKAAEKDAVLFPINTAIKPVVAKILGTETRAALRPFFTEIQNKLDTFSYMHVPDFFRDLSAACSVSLKVAKGGGSPEAIKLFKRRRMLISRIWSDVVGKDFLALIEKEVQLYTTDRLALMKVLSEAQSASLDLPVVVLVDDSMVDAVDEMDIDVIEQHSGVHNGAQNGHRFDQESSESITVVGPTAPPAGSVINEALDEDEDAPGEDDDEAQFAPIPADITARASQSVEPQSREHSYQPRETGGAERPEGVPEMYEGSVVRPVKPARQQSTPPGSSNGTQAVLIAEDDDIEDTMSEEVSLPPLKRYAETLPGGDKGRQTAASEELSELDDEAFKSMGNLADEDAAGNDSATEGDTGSPTKTDATDEPEEDMPRSSRKSARTSRSGRR